MTPSPSATQEWGRALRRIKLLHAFGQIKKERAKCLLPLTKNLTAPWGNNKTPKGESHGEPVLQLPPPLELCVHLQHQRLLLYFVSSFSCGQMIRYPNDNTSVGCIITRHPHSAQLQGPGEEGPDPVPAEMPCSQGELMLAHKGWSLLSPVPQPQGGEGSSCQKGGRATWTPQQLYACWSRGLGIRAR